MKWRPRTRWALGVSATFLVAAGTLAFASVTPRAALTGGGALDRTGASSHQSGEANLRQLTKQLSGSVSTAALVPLSAELAGVARGQTVAHFQPNAPGMPTCKAPPLPAATYPPGQGYGVPFLAAVTNGVLLSGYDEWTADHSNWKVKKKTYHLYPWQTEVYDITGWVSGLLELPTLSAEVTPQDVVFCDQGGLACETANPTPTGGCLRVLLGGQPEPGLAPFPPITNDPPPGKACQGSPYCIPYVVTLTPVGDTTLTVTGVEPDGAIDLSIKTSAQTTASLTEGTLTQSCENPPTSVTLSTKAPTALPPGAPIAPTAGNPDYRSLQAKPLPLTGPLAGSSSTASSNDFYVPAFANPPTKACPADGIAATLNTPLGGWNVKGNSNFYRHRPLPVDAGLPGWVQFSVTTTVFTLDFPVGPPSNFGF